MKQKKNVRPAGLTLNTVAGFVLLLAACGNPGKAVRNSTGATYATDPPAAQPMKDSGRIATADTTGHFPATGRTPAGFIPQGYEPGPEAEGLLDNDSLPDYVLVLNPKEDRAAARPCLVLLQETGGGYRLAHISWKAVQPGQTAEGYPIYDSEDMRIEKHTLQLDMFSPGAAGNLSTVYRYEGPDLVLASIHTYNMGAGSHTEVTYNLASGRYEETVTNTMVDSMPAETTLKNYARARVSFEAADPLQIIHAAYDKAAAK